MRPRSENSMNRHYECGSVVAQMEAVRAVTAWEYCTTTPHNDFRTLSGCCQRSASVAKLLAVCIPTPSYAQMSRSTRISWQAYAQPVENSRN